MSSPDVPREVRDSASRRPPRLLAAGITTGVVLLLAVGLLAIGGAPAFGLCVASIVPLLYGIYLLVRRRPRWGIGMLVGSILAFALGIVLTPTPDTGDATPPASSADASIPSAPPQTPSPTSLQPTTAAPPNTVKPTPSPPATALSSTQAATGDVAWTKVTNGTWEYGDVGFGEPVETRLSDYRITISGKPTMTTADGGQTVKITSPIAVEKIRDRGFNSPDTPIGESEQFIFMPGPANTDLNEDYGEGTVVDIKTPGKVGQTAKGTVSFTAPAAEIVDCFWMINREIVAAWPGQTT
jgi:hypothetical protein